MTARKTVRQDVLKDGKGMITVTLSATMMNATLTMETARSSDAVMDVMTSGWATCIVTRSA